jgi:uracil-DNA glycosylase family 4
MPSYVAGTGPLEPDLMIIGEAPGRLEDQQGVPFVGPSGQILDECLRKAGMRRSECYITNVVKYQPPFNDFDKLTVVGIDAEAEAEKLWIDEIYPRKPKTILAVGARALRAVLGWPVIFNTKSDKLKITDLRGSILTAKDGETKVVGTIHPAALFNRYAGGDQVGGLEYTYLKLIEHDIIRAAEESKSRELNLPDRNLIVAHNSLDLYKFFREYEKLDKATVDIESVNCVPVTIGFAFNRHEGISVPLLRSVGKHKLTDMGENELNEVWRLIDAQLRRLKLIGHNFKYDEFKLNLIG